MPSNTLRGIIMGIVCMSLSLAAVIPGDARAQRVAMQTLQVDLEPGLRALLANAEDLLAAGNAEAAYGLLLPEERRHAGNPLFDYLLGVAALDTGRASEAIFSLQRALTVAPGFSGARLELARAWFDAGHPERARPLFVQTLDEQPPPALHDVIVRYLLAIDAGPAAPQSRLSWFAEVVTGHDSNANGSTSDEQFLGFMLNSNNVRAPSLFADMAVGLDWMLPRSNRFIWYANGRAAHRRNPDAAFVDATIVDAESGFSWRRGRYFGRVGINGYHGARDGESNESFAGADLMVGQRMSDNWDLSFGLQGGAQRFDSAIDVLDVDRLLYSLTAARRYANGLRISIGAIGGNDSEREAGSPYGNRKLGVRATLGLPLGNAGRLAASLGSLRSDYDGQFFGANREDTQVSGFIELQFRDVLVKGLSVTPRIRYVDNDSDIALYKYDRSEIGVGLKWTGR
jgi:outer membrane protein